MENPMGIADIKRTYPDEWVLLGNPVWDDTDLRVLSGILLYHSKDKREVCYLGREKTGPYQTITLMYTGEQRKNTRVLTGIFNRVKS